MSSASTFNPTGGCAKGHYQLIAFCSLELTGSRFLCGQVFSVRVLLEQCGRSAGALEALRGLRMEPRDGDARGRGTGGFALSFQSGRLDLSVPLTCAAHSYFLPRMKTIFTAECRIMPEAT